MFLVKCLYAISFDISINSECYSTLYQHYAFGDFAGQEGQSALHRLKDYDLYHPRINIMDSWLHGGAL